MNTEQMTEVYTLHRSSKTGVWGRVMLGADIIIVEDVNCRLDSE
jgi:hypothetical protein